MDTKSVTVTGSVERIPAAWFGFIVVGWAVFAAVLVIEPVRFTELWAALRDLPIAGEVVVWIALLPWVVAMAIWGSSWALWVRVALIALIAVFTLVASSPKRERS
jgi:phosphatidylserine synthase